jgi:hypothetical protein
LNVTGLNEGSEKLSDKKLGEKKDLLNPFVAEGVIVRVLEDGRGFSFRFEGLSRESQEAIERYIDHN